MAKSKSKSKKDKKPVNDKLEAIKLFTKSTAIDVSDLMKHKTFEEVVQHVYLPINGKISADLIKRYEKQLLLCKLDYEKFRSGLHMFYTETYKYIKENKLFKDFYDIVLFINIEMSRKDDFDVDVKSAYLSLFIQQSAYFKGVDTVVYGVTTNGELLYMPEPIRDYYKISFETNKVVTSGGSIHDIPKIFAKFGYPNVNPRLSLALAGLDKGINGTCFQMAGLINEHNKDKIFPKKFANLNHVYEYNPLFVFGQSHNTLMKYLEKRHKFLPVGGIEAELGNCGDIERVFLLEELHDDMMMLLFKITYKDGGAIQGFYTPQDRGYYDTWLSSIDANPSCDKMALFTRGVVLQLYADLTVNFESSDVKDGMVLFNSGLFEKVGDEVKARLPQVRYLVHHDYRIVSPHDRNFIRANYNTALAQVQPFLRRLPMGASPSQEAKDLAEKLGIDLPIGYTIVKEFKKKVYVNKER